MRNLIAIIILAISLSGCKKYLDEIPDKNLAIPASVQEFQSLEDFEVMYNRNSPGCTDFGTDDIQIPFSQFQSANYVVRNSYTWANDIFNGQTPSDWQFPYKAIYYSNLVLEGLEKLSTDNLNETAFRNLKGRSLFFRGINHFHLSQVFMKQFNVNTAGQDLGVPYKITSLVDEQISRGTVSGTYSNIIADLKLAIQLLPENIDVSKPNRPSKFSGYAALARVYLTMRDYSKALLYADSCLKNYNKLIDYNDINTNANNPFSGLDNVEILEFSTAGSYLSRIPVDEAFFSTYSVDDLRKTCFFRVNPTLGTHEFKGSYAANLSAYRFCGIATDEIYLIRAECLARSGKAQDAIDDLNALLVKRYKRGTFHPYVVSQVTDLLGLILEERRKELVFRELRWSDLRRLNMEMGGYQKTISRVVDGKIYQILPNDIKYVYPLPNNEIGINRLEQNPR